MPPTNNYACPRATTFQSRETVSSGSIGFRNGFRLPCLKGHNSIRPRQYRGLAIPTPEAGKKRRRCEGGVEISAVLVGCRRARSVQEDRFSYLINTTNTRDDLRDSTTFVCLQYYVSCLLPLLGRRVAPELLQCLRYTIPCTTTRHHREGVRGGHRWYGKTSISERRWRGCNPPRVHVGTRQTRTRVCATRAITANARNGSLGGEREF